jgi:hypothetical protein
MPPLIAAMLLGAGAYAGFRAARHVWTHLFDTRTSAEAPAPKQSGDALVKDLGPLELDPSTGIYRPIRRD